MNTRTSKSAEPHAGEVIVGFTKSNRAADYSSFSDGYREGADQDEFTISAPPDITDVEALAEAIFVGSNSPEVCDGLARTFQLWLADLPVRSLSVGDTVTLRYDGEPAQKVACEPRGWRRVQ